MNTPGATTPDSSESDKSPVAKRNLPTGQLGLATLAVNAANAWMKRKELGDLLWITKADFLDGAEAFASSRDTADAADDERSPQARRLRAMDKEIDKSLGHVKGYLAEDHEGDADEAFYDEFGIEKGRNHRLPTARPARAKALGKLLKALEAHGYNDRKFGKAYWTPIEDEYRKLVKARVKTEGDASGEVGKKNVQEKPLRKVLKALVKLVQAHYPDTYPSVLREFGFQKESY